MENPVNTIVGSDQNASNSALAGEKLEDALLKQIDYYFSRQNLANDAYLVSQMDPDLWVPIEIIAGFKKVGILTTDATFIAHVMTKSPNVVVDTQKKMIKPSWKLQRNTIILRDMPADASAEEVRALFSGKFSITDTHSDVGNSWFISFDTEDTALDAMMWVRNQQFRGKEVKARMKSEHLLKTSTPYVTGALPETYGYFPTGAYMGPQAYPHIPQGQYWQVQADRPYRDRSQNPTSTVAQASYRGKGQVGFYGPGGNLDQVLMPTPLSTTPPRVSDQDDRKTGKSRKPKKAPESKPLPFVSVPQMNTQHFPPLGRQRAGSFKTGYSKDFKKFSRDDILRVIQTVTDIASTEILAAAKECGVLANSPNKTLEIANAPVPMATVIPAKPQEVVEPIKEWPQREWPEKQPTKVDTQPSPSPVDPSPMAEAQHEKLLQPILSPATPIKSMPKVPSYADIALGVSRTSSPPITQTPASTPQ
jgi:hypothetical protein